MGIDNTIHIIFDARQSEDYGRLLGEFIEQGIDKYKFWDAIVLKDSVVKSINASHKMIVRWAKDNGKEYVVIAEQDLFFTSKNSWKYFLDNMPKSFDIYLASTYIVPISNNKICGFHCYIVHSKFYDTFLSVDDNLHIDTAVGDLGGDYHFCYPFPCLQRIGFSANNHAIVDYNKLLKEEDIYK
jgi:hypothetical protein